MSIIIDRILNKIGDDEILEKLLSLSRSDLNSLLLELFMRQSKELSATDILQIYHANRFSIPSDIDPAKIHALESWLLLEAQKENIETIQLSPAATIASCSTFGFVNQYNVVSALRGTEILSDPSNMLAIIIADRIKNSEAVNIPSLHYASTARVVRSQNFSGKGFFSHFSLYCMVSSGRDTGSYNCESELLEKHLLYYKNLFQVKLKMKISIVLRKRSGYKDNDGFFNQMTETVKNIFPNITLSFDYSDIDNKYYKGFNFKIYMDTEGEKLELCDGGFVDWINQMLGDKKERCLISGVGLDRLLIFYESEDSK